MSAYQGGLAQLARALALQAKGHRFDSDILHIPNPEWDFGLVLKILIMALGLLIRNQIIINILISLFGLR